MSRLFWSDYDGGGSVIRHDAFAVMSSQGAEFAPFVFREVGILVVRAAGDEVDALSVANVLDVADQEVAEVGPWLAARYVCGDHVGDDHRAIGVGPGLVRSQASLMRS